MTFLANQPILYNKSFALHSKILIIDDSQLQQEILVKVLNNSGFNNLIVAENGVEGFEMALSQRPDLIILDIIMPLMDGLEFCKKSHVEPLLKDIPILVQTARTSSKDKEDIFKAGASDYVPKPIDERELIARVFSHLERVKWLSQLIEFHSRMQKELEVAAQTQKVLFPSSDKVVKIRERCGIEIRHYYRTSSELGGDFWGAYPLSSTKLIVYIVDFSGHGINAALNTFRLHTLMLQLFDQGLDAGQFVTRLNDKLVKILPTGQFATMFYGIIDTAEQVMHYATAGCPTPFVFREDHQVESIPGHGYLLGTLADTVYENKQMPFRQGDMLFLYSDALTESPDLDGHVMTEKEIIDYFNDKPKRGFGKLLKKLKSEYPASWPDDLTLAAYYFESYLADKDK